MVQQRFPQQEEPELIPIHGIRHQYKQQQQQQVLLPEHIPQWLQMLMDVQLHKVLL